MSTDVMNIDNVPVLSENEARELTASIQNGLLNVWDLVKRAYQGRVWQAMGYESWLDYCNCEFDRTVFRIRLPQEERKETVASLRDAGLSIRAIHAVTGIADKTVQKDLKDHDADQAKLGVVKDNTKKIIGADGKSYPATKTKTTKIIEPAIKPKATAVEHYDWDAPSDKPKAGKKARKGKVRVTMAVTHIYEIDLDSYGYNEFKTLEEAAKCDVEAAKDDPAAFIQMATEEDQDSTVLVEHKWL